MTKKRSEKHEEREPSTSDAFKQLRASMDRKNEGAFGTPAYMGRDTHNVGQYGGTSVADAFKSLKTPSSGLQKRGKKVEKEKSFADMFADLKGEK